MIKDFQQIAAFTEENSASMEELNTTFEQIRETATTLMSVAITKSNDENLFSSGWVKNR